MLVTVPVTGVVWFIISALVLRAVPKLSKVRQVIHPEEALLLGFVFVRCHDDVIHHSCPSSILR
jgi:hypothetical protein